MRSLFPFYFEFVSVSCCSLPLDLEQNNCD
jgi:hypothetical protein